MLSEHCFTMLDWGVFFFFFFLRLYLFIHERQREREREAETQAEGEAGSMQGPRCGTRPQDSGVTTWAEGGHSTAEPPRHPVLLIPVFPLWIPFLLVRLEWFHVWAPLWGHCTSRSPESQGDPLRPWEGVSGSL